MFLGNRNVDEKDHELNKYVKFKTVNHNENN